MTIKDEILEKLAQNDTKETIKEVLEENRQELAKVLKDKGLLDALQEKIISRKLLVFATATALFAFYGLDADTWGMIAMAYIGGQTMIDFARVWKGQ